MGRTKRYATAAERQAAYRRRFQEETLVMDRHAIEQLDQRLTRLHDAIRTAAQHGDPLAHRVRSGSMDRTLEKLTDFFLAQAQGAK